MRRIRGERGAVGVVVALLIVPLIGFAAISIDLAAMWGERQQLQTGADAAAFAIAQDCARGDCKNPPATAQDLATKNLPNSQPVATLAATPTPGAGKVTVRNVGVQKYWFAPVLGFNQGTITTQATVSWGAPTGGTAALPLAFNRCEFDEQTVNGLPSGTVLRTIYFTKSSDTQCKDKSGNLTPGGFGWITTPPGTCLATTVISSIVGTDTGKNEPGNCSEAVFAPLRDKTVLLPLFDQYGGTGAGAWYHIYGYAAFIVKGYHFGNGSNNGCWNPGVDKCGGNERSITGYFTRFVDLSEAFTYGAGPDLGSAIISLTE